MLYKKYHRNFVKQFKKGVRFRSSFYKQPVVCEIDVEPYYDGWFWRRNIRITGNNTNTGTKYNFVLVRSGGQLPDINVV